MDEQIENGKVVDLTYVKDLARGNKAFIKEIITLFLSENPLELTAIEKAINANDFEAVKSTAHKLKSTIPFIGLDKLVGTNVTEMESLAADKTSMAQIRSHFEKVKQTCEKAYNELGPMQAEL